jgi:hypothetical protein
MKRLITILLTIVFLQNQAIALGFVVFTPNIPFSIEQKFLGDRYMEYEILFPKGTGEAQRLNYIERILGTKKNLK